MRVAQLYDDEPAGRGADTEFSLGLGSLLAIFFGLVLICGVCFGFGYNFGHRGPALPSAPAAESAKQADPLVAPKPSAQSLQHPEESDRVVVPADDAPRQDSPHAPVPAVAAKAKTAESAAPSASFSPKPLANPDKRPLPPTNLQAATIMVQIAAVKNNPDAQALASALRRNGFTPAVRNEPQDKLIHVQVGPFLTMDEARTMRQQLVNAGYNAFIK